MLENNKSYNEFLIDIKTQIKSSQQRALLAVNKELILLYWNIGSKILEAQGKEGWGAKIIETLSKELKNEFPDLTGFSSRNLKYMRNFAETYRDFLFVQQVVAQIPWGHNLVLIEKIKSSEQRQWYVLKTIENGWSRNTLVHQIESDLYSRQVTVEKTTNFMSQLPVPQNKSALETLKDPYVFDFITMREEMNERDIEAELVKRVTQLLLEMGSGFAFLGNQYHLNVGGDDYYLDLLFYNLKLRCYVVVELKTGKFKPEYAGKLNFYLSAVDDLIKNDEDNPTIGIILCKEKNKIVAEYALKDISKPIGVSEYKLCEDIPEDMVGTLPSIEELEDKLESIIE